MEQKWTETLSLCQIDDVATFRGARLRLEILRYVRSELQHVMETGMMVNNVQEENAEREAMIERDLNENG